jgi:hypothetical protein
LVTSVTSTHLFDFLELVKKKLGATDVRVLDEEQGPPPSPGELMCELPSGHLLGVSFSTPPPDPNEARKRLELLVQAFSSMLTDPELAPAHLQKELALYEELRSLAGRAGALDTFVIDAHSPAVWGRAFDPPVELETGQPATEPQNVVRIDGQPISFRPTDLAERARELGVRAVEALAIDPRTLHLLPQPFCQKHCLLPLFASSSGLLLSMADPTDVDAIYEAVRLTGLPVEPALASEKLVRFVLAWNYGSPAHDRPAQEPSEDPAREPLAASVRDRWMRHFAFHRALAAVRSMPELGTLHRGGHLNRTVAMPDLVCVTRSFAGIYVLVTVFRPPLDELRAKSAISQALPLIEALVLALPPRDPPPSIAGARAMRRPVPR